MSYDGKGGKQHNASVLSDKIGMGLHSRISDSKKESYPYVNSLVVVNQPWVELPDNPFGQPTIKAKGGNALWTAASIVYLFGNQKNSGVSFIPATKNGRKIIFATRTKISVLKNHITGLAFQDGRIIATPHNFINDTKEALEQYKTALQLGYTKSIPAIYETAGLSFDFSSKSIENLASLLRAELFG
jgi:hypothetical protein